MGRVTVSKTRFVMPTPLVKSQIKSVIGVDSKKYQVTNLKSDKKYFKSDKNVHYAILCFICPQSPLAPR